MRDIVIVTGLHGTRIFIDKKKMLDDKEFMLFGAPGNGPQRLVLGGSLTGKYTWNGVMYCFSLFAGDASQSLLQKVDKGPCTVCDGMPAAQYVLGFAFEKPDSFVRNCASDRHALVIRGRFPIIGGNVLVAPWDDFTYDASYYSDIVVNLLGFVPFGYFFAKVLSMLRPLWRRRLIAAVVVAGFALSLGIELAQVYLPGRSSQLSDLICNTIGSFSGAYLFFRVRLFRRASRETPRTSAGRSV